VTRTKRSMCVGLVCISSFSCAAHPPLPASPPPAEVRLDPEALGAWRKTLKVEAGTSGVAGIETSNVKGNPQGAGLYTIMLRVPPNTRIAAHSHPDDRAAVVASGTWYFGYGNVFDEASLRPLPPGSFYTEPPSVLHFARTGDTAAVLLITGVGPTGTTYANSAEDPRAAPSSEKPESSK
jgi:quercetin dioxygenase-like cupin family protein